MCIFIVYRNYITVYTINAVVEDIKFQKKNNNAKLHIKFMKMTRNSSRHRKIFTINIQGGENHNDFVLNKAQYLVY